MLFLQRVCQEARREGVYRPLTQISLAGQIIEGDLGSCGITAHSEKKHANKELDVLLSQAALGLMMAR